MDNYMLIIYLFLIFRELMKKYKIGDLIIDPANCKANFNVKE